MRSPNKLQLAVALCASLVGMAAFTNIAPAADLAMPGLGAAPAVQAEDQPVEWGSGWYLRGDLGGGTLSTPDFNSNLKVSSKHTFSSGIGFGYKVNDWMRFDTTLDYHWGGQANAAVTGLSCPLTMAAPANYYDTGPTGTSTPTAYVYTDTLGVSHSWDRTDARKGITNFAWAAMGGVAIDVSAHTKLDIGLKYLNMGHISYLDSATGVTRSKAFTTKSVHVGMRYMID